MPTPPTNQASIEQLHRAVAALADDMDRPPQNMLRASVVRFCIGASLALTFIALSVWIMRLL
jgi:hypothetical protein